MMLHTKFREKRSTISTEDFFKGFYLHGSHFGHVTSIVLINFHFLVPKSLHNKFGYKWLNGF